MSEVQCVIEYSNLDFHDVPTKGEQWFSRGDVLTITPSKDGQRVNLKISRDGDFAEEYHLTEGEGVYSSLTRFNSSKYFELLSFEMPIFISRPNDGMWDVEFIFPIMRAESSFEKNPFVFSFIPVNHTHKSNHTDGSGGGYLK